MKHYLLDQPDRVGPYVCGIGGGVWYPGKGETIGLEENGRLIAGAIFDNYNGRSVQVHVAASDPKKFWLGRDGIWLCFAYPFSQLKVSKLLAPVGQGNVAAIRFALHLGFQLEATLKDAHPTGNLLVYGMHRADCHWLNILREKRLQNGKFKRAPAAGLHGAGEAAGY